jgi:hypothetical protein
VCIVLFLYVLLYWCKLWKLCFLTRQCLSCTTSRMQDYPLVKGCPVELRLFYFFKDILS